MEASGEQSQREPQYELKRIDGTLLKNPLFGLYFPDFNPRRRVAIISDLAESIKTYGADRKREVRVRYEVVDGKTYGAHISSKDGAIWGVIKYFLVLNLYCFGPLRAEIITHLITRVPEDEHSGLAKVVSEQGFSLR